MSSRKRLAGSKSLSFALVTLLALSSVGFAVPRGTVRPRKSSGHAAHMPPAQLGLLYDVNSTGDGDNAGPVTGCDADLATPGDQCTLRAAIQAANANPGDDGIDIYFPASDPGCDPATGRCVINLTKALPDLSTNIEINGPGADKLTVQRNTGDLDLYRIFNVTTTGVVTLSGMTISRGEVKGDSSGGGILNSLNGTVNVNNCAVTDNIAGGYFGGGGIHNYNNGTVNVKNSLVARNRAIAAGGGCCSDAHGGGIGNSNAGTVNIINSTITGNWAQAANGGGSGSEGTGEGGGIFNSSSGTVNITNSTISGNFATSPGNGLARGGGILNQAGIFNLKSTIVANNTANTYGPDAAAELTSHGYNLIEDTVGATVVQHATDRFGVDPKLGPLQNNGGPTETMALLAGSPAIDKATSAGLNGPLSTDQRGTGFPRPIDDSLISNAAGGDGTDIGAFEVQSAVQFSSAAYTVNEATASITIIVRRTGSREQAATVRYTTSNGTAAAGKDYTAKSGMLSFAVGEASKSFTVAITNDVLDEADETVKLTLGSPTGGVSLGTPSTALLKIVDNDLPPTLSITNSTITEGNSGALNATFTVSLSAVSGKTVTVRYATANGTAAAPADYTAKALTTLTFSPGQTSKPVTIAVRGDLLDEANETFFVNLSTPVNATFADNQALCTITDNDLPPSITITNVTVTEPDSGAVTASFAIKLSAASGLPVTVKYATANGTTNPAAAGTDYTALALTSWTFAPGQITKSVVVQVKGDLLKELNETFFVNLSGAVNAAIADAQGLGTILNDD